MRLNVRGLYNKDDYGRDCVCLKPPCLELYKDPSDLSHSLEKSLVSSVDSMGQYR